MAKVTPIETRVVKLANREAVGLVADKIYDTKTQPAVGRVFAARPGLFKVIVADEKRRGRPPKHA